MADQNLVGVIFNDEGQGVAVERAVAKSNPLFYSHYVPSFASDRPAILRLYSIIKEALISKVNGTKIQLIVVNHKFKPLTRQVVYAACDRFGILAIDANQRDIDRWSIFTEMTMLSNKSPVWMRNPAIHNYNGAQQPDVILVGERHNYTYGTDLCLPFGLPGHSTNWLHRTIDYAGVSEDIGYINALDDDSKKILERAVACAPNGAKLIAMGSEALTWLEGIYGSGNIMFVNHPSYAARFRANQLSDYAAELRGAIELSKPVSS